MSDRIADSDKMSMDDPLDAEKGHEVFWAKIVVTVITVIVICQVFYNVNHWGTEPTTIGTIGAFGDSFGFINAAASSLAFAGAIFAILL